MERLPTEISLEIVNYLSDTHMSSLRSFSLVNSRFHKLATSGLFRTLYILCDSTLDLSEDVQTAGKILAKYDCASVVKTLFVEDFWRAEYKPVRYHWETSDPYCGSIAEDCHKKTVDGRDYQWARLPEPADEAAFWESFAVLLDSLPALKDVIFDAYAQFPLCALEVLHRRSPHCRLHMPKFRLRSLSEAKVDPRELTLMTSPCLFSITAHITDNFNQSSYDFNWDAVFEMAEGATPNLEHVRLVEYDTIPLSWEWDPNAFRKRRGVPARQARFCNSPVDRAKASKLRGLGFTGPLRDLKPRLCGVMKTRRLHALEIAVLCQSDLDFLAELSSFEELEFITRLKFRINSQPGASINLALERFLGHLPNLNYLEVPSFHDGPKYPAPALKIRGCVLQELDVGCHTLDADAVLMLQEDLPQLRSICFRMIRSLSLPPETDIYTALSTFPNLRNAALTLSPLQRSVVPLQLWDNGRSLGSKLDREDIFDARDLSNMAVDAELTRQIWNEVTRGKPKPAKFTLRVHCDLLGCGHLEFLFLSPHWSFCGNNRPGTNEPEVKNITPGNMTYYHKKEPKQRPGPNGRKSELDIFKILWPRKRGSSSYLDDWHSLPLRFRRDLEE
ncbi:uncharacterized protein K489DRAFT_372183 [Dissoconium aciculare CBS 342.82]|uniref:F-box domain-containing protein n=1 Tax=Dissoconium aciculare CBS 342.82 TaxID=1314786 RepID=A0A6J3M2V5_9PEZI|nr:uncharacterized protein K489DRAFT_372183 [Dissoconium aciculare CBS 342.82]KAF1821267.1 hypothetical protein K489DRAFT_372183 [Dissoconium aciculare CBS 342.82]